MANKKNILFDRYFLTTKKVDDFVRPGKLRYGLWRAPNITIRPELELDPRECDKYIVARKDIGRIDLLAWKYYGDVSLWWIIATYNHIANPLTDLEIGQILFIPKKSVVDSKILDSQK